MGRKKIPHGDVTILVIAAVFTAAEAMVEAGVELAFSDVIPRWQRAAIGGMVMGAAFAFRIWASRRWS